MKNGLFLTLLVMVSLPIQGFTQEWTERARRALLGLDGHPPSLQVAHEYLLNAHRAGEEGATEILRRIEIINSPAVGQLRNLLDEARESLRTRIALSAEKSFALDEIARRGHPDARRLSGALHALSIHSDSSPALGLAFLRAAIADGDGEAAVFLAILMEANGSSSRDILEAWESAERLGHSQARAPAAIYRSMFSPQKEIVAFFMPIFREAERNPEGSHAMALDRLQREIPEPVLRDIRILLEEERRRMQQQ
jgi:hypothetical protein